MLSIALIDANIEFAYVLKEFLEEIKGFSISMYHSVHYAKRQLERHHFDIAIVDVGLKGCNGIKLIDQMANADSDTKYLVLAQCDDDETFFCALDAGANGYLLKNTKPEKIADSLIELSNGGAPMSAAVSDKLLKYFSSRRKKETKCKLLSIREKQVLQQVSRGLVYKEVAALLGIQPETVKKHISNICFKLDVQNKMEAVNIYFGM